MEMLTTCSRRSSEESNSSVPEAGTDISKLRYTR
jgi:hypothetical protein